MRVELTSAACTLYREPGDRALSAASNTAFHMRRLLNAQGHHFTRFNPSRYGLTDCKVGIWDKRVKIMLWHERYVIEFAHQAFNSGHVTFNRVTAE